MKIVPSPYYKCDYCDTTSEKPDFKYTDNSGVDNQCYDMCSERCKDKHVEYLKTQLTEGELKDHLEHCWF